MRVVIQQPQFLPWVGYWNKVWECDAFVFYTGVQHTRGHGNRVTIEGDWLTLPLAAGAERQLIRDVRLVDPSDLQRIGKRLRHTFAKSTYPYRDRLAPVFRRLDVMQDRFLADVAIRLHEAVAEAIGLRRAVFEDSRDRGGDHPSEKLDAVLHSRWAGMSPTYLTGKAAEPYLRSRKLLEPDRVLVQNVEPDAPTDSFLEVIAVHPDPINVMRMAARWEVLT